CDASSARGAPDFNGEMWIEARAIQAGMWHGEWLAAALHAASCPPGPARRAIGGRYRRDVLALPYSLFSIPHSLLRKHVPSRPAIQRHEWFAVVVSFVFFFLVLAAYYVIRPVRDQLVAAVGSTALPIFYAATFVATF